MSSFSQLEVSPWAYSVRSTEASGRLSNDGAYNERQGVKATRYNQAPPGQNTDKGKGGGDSGDSIGELVFRQAQVTY